MAVACSHRAITRVACATQSRPLGYTGPQTVLAVSLNAENNQTRASFPFEITLKACEVLLCEDEYCYTKHLFQRQRTLM